MSLIVEIGFLAVVAIMSLPAAAAPQLIPAARTFTAKEGVFTCEGDVAACIRFEADSSIPKEGYRLAVATNGISLASSDGAGRFYALETLKQMAERDGRGCVQMPCAVIDDSPRYPWRGVLLDECRHFFGKETVKSILDLMARYKLNRFHWHLTEGRAAAHRRVLIREGVNCAPLE